MSDEFDLGKLEKNEISIIRSALTTQRTLLHLFLLEFKTQSHEIIPYSSYYSDNIRLQGFHK